MPTEPPAPQPEKVAAFFQKHRTGLATIVFTDLVDSTDILGQLGDQAGTTFLRQRRQVLRGVLHLFRDAEEIETAGDSFLLAFAKPSDAVRFALLTQARLRAFSAEARLPLQERIGIHLGEVVISEHETEVKVKDLYGMQLATCARVMALAQGGQILLTRGVFDSARQVLKGEDLPGVGPLSWVSHGPYQMKGIEEPVEVCEVGEADFSPLAAPKTSEKAQRQVRSDEEPVLGWRPAVGQAVPSTKWVLEEKLGEGGFGEVWKARHEKLSELRVFKFCFRADRVRSLKREVTLFRLLKDRIGEHPNLVKLHDIYFDQPPYYLEEEYVAGKDLKTWCEARGGIDQVPLGTRLEIVAQAADALQAAHDAGIIHRDVKPGNILIEESGTRSAERRSGGDLAESRVGASGARSALAVKVTDFGIGQVVSAEVLAGVTQAGFTQTMLGSTSTGLGTTMYLAPEIVAGEPATTRSDIYSLGAVLYQLLIKDFRSPVTTDWAKRVGDSLLREDLRLCFAGNPNERFTGAGQLGRRLRALPERRAELERRKAERVALERAAYRRGMMRTAGVAAIIVVVVAGLALLALTQSRRAKAAAAAELGERQRAERHLYVANMSLAQQAWEQGDVGQVRRFLDETAAYADRGFEWYYWQQQTHLETKTLRGHSAAVSSVAFSPDGQRIATGSWDYTAKVWDAGDGHALHTLAGHRSYIWSVAFSPDGRRIVTVSADQTTRLWEAASGKELFTLRGHRAPVYCTAFSPDGQRIVTGSADRTVRVWETASGRELLTLGGHGAGLTGVAFSPDGQRIITVSRDQTARLWEAASGRQLSIVKGPDGWIESVAFSRDGRRIVSGGSDPAAEVWEAGSGRELLTLKRHSANVMFVAFSPEGRRIATGSMDQTAKVWDAATGNALFTLKGHSADVISVAFSPDGQRIATGSMDQTTKVWEAVDREELITLRGHHAPVLSVAVSLDGQRIVTGSGDKTVKVWEAPTGKALLTLVGHQALIWSVAFSPDGQRIAAGGWDTTTRVWDAARGEEQLVLEGHTAAVQSLAFSPDGRRIVTGSGDETARVWEVSTGKQLLTLQGHGAPIWSVALSPDGRRIVTGSGDETAKIWDATHGRELLTLEGHGAPIWSVAFSPDGRRIATGSGDRTAKVWDATHGKELLTLEGHGAPIRSVAFSPNGQRIVTGSRDQTAKLWDVPTGRELLTLKGHTDGIRSVVFSPDGQRIVTASDDRTVRVWTAATATRVAAWQEEEKAAAEHMAVLRRDAAAAAERERAQRAQDPGAIKEWLVLAPIPYEGLSAPAALAQEQLRGESDLRPRAAERVKVGASECVWRPVRLKDHLLDFNLLLGMPNEWSVAYAVCYILSEASQTGLVASVGSDDQAKLYLNGKEIYNRTEPQTYVPDQHEVAGLNLNAGLNVLVFKVVNESHSWQGSVRLTDAAGQPVPGLRVTLDPEGRSEDTL